MQINRYISHKLILSSRDMWWTQFTLFSHRTRSGTCHYFGHLTDQRINPLNWENNCLINQEWVEALVKTEIVHHGLANVLLSTLPSNMVNIIPPHCHEGLSSPGMVVFSKKDCMQAAGLVCSVTQSSINGKCWSITSCFHPNRWKIMWLLESFIKCGAMTEIYREIKAETERERDEMLISAACLQLLV